MNSASDASIENKKLFERQGFLTIPDALSSTQIASLIAAIDKLIEGEPGKIHNVADIFGKHDAFLDLLDLPTVLPTVRELLSSNIWVNHSHFNANPASNVDDVSRYSNGYGWHRDGGVIHQDLPWPPPLLSIKIGFYLTDLTEPGRGQTCFIRDSHKTGEKPPGSHELPDQAISMLVKPGTAVLFDRRLIHSMRSANNSEMTRYVVFIQYAFRWMAAVDAMNVESLRRKCSPIRQQLLGLTTKVYTLDGAEGRSGLYYPGARDIPMSGGKVPSLFERILSRALRILRPTK